MNKLFISLTIVSVLFLGCKKPEDRTCFKSYGKEVVLEHAFPGTVGQLYLGAHLEYELIQDSLNKIEIIGGANVVKHVEFELSGDKLSFKNANSCNFLRNERKVIKVRIHCTNIYNIHFEGTEPFRTIGTLHSDYFVLFIRDGAGPVTMDLKSVVLSADISHGWGNYTLSGTANYAEIGARSNGFCNTENLIVSDSIYVSNETVGTIRVNANQIPLKGYMRFNGITEYVGTPSSIDIVNAENGTVRKVN